MTAADLRDIHPLMVSQPAKVRRRETGEVLHAMYYKRDLTNLAQIEAWLLDAILSGPCSSGRMTVAGPLGEVGLNPGEFIVECLGGGFMVFRADEFPERFDHRLGGD